MWKNTSPDTKKHYTKKFPTRFVFLTHHPLHSPTSSAFYGGNRRDEKSVCPWNASETLTASWTSVPVGPQCRNSGSSFFMSPNISKHAADGLAEISITSLEVTQEPPRTWSGFPCNKCHSHIHWSLLANIYLVQFTSVGEQLSLSLNTTMINTSPSGDCFKWKNTSIRKHSGSS